MVNGQDANLDHHQVQNSNVNDMDDKIIIGSIIACITIFVIAVIIAIWWFYKKNFKNKGHSKIEIEDIDDMQDEDVNGMNVTTDNVKILKI